MDHDRRLAALTRAHQRVAATAPEVLLADVPSCPGWSGERVLLHLGRVHRWVTLTLSQPPDAPLPRAPKPDDDADAVAWYVDGASALIEALGAAEPDQPVATWAGTADARWWTRRMLHETTLHAWDLTGAAGSSLDIDPDVAVDAIDEVLEVFLAHRFDLAVFEPAGETVHLHATDVTGEWLVEFAPEGIEVRREHAKGDVAARDTAGTLALLLWSRLDPGEVTTFGEAQILTRYQQAANF